MKTKLVLALVAILAIGIVLTFWKPASAPPPNQPDAAPSEQSALEQIAESSQEAPTIETIAPVPPAVARRKAPAPLQVQTPTATAAELLAQIQTALSSTNLDDRDNVFTNLLAELVHTDPLAAARIAETNSFGEFYSQLLHRVAQLWAATNSAAALNWAASLNNPTQRDAMLTDVCLQLATSDPAEAVKTRSQFVTDAQPNVGLEALAQRWGEKDFSAALDWALSRDAGEQRDQLVARLAFVQSQTSPFEAATLVVGRIPAGAAQTEAAMAVLHQWAKRDFPAAEQWVTAFPEGDLRTRAVSELEGLAQYQSAAQSP